MLALVFTVSHPLALHRLARAIVSKTDTTIEIFCLTILEVKTPEQYHDHSRIHRESMLAGSPSSWSPQMVLSCGTTHATIIFVEHFPMSLHIKPLRVAVSMSKPFFL